MSKICNTCKEVKAFSFFASRGKGRLTYASNCKSCHAKYVKQRYKETKTEWQQRSKDWAKENKEKRKQICRNSVRKKNGNYVSEEIFNEMKKTQKGLCSICGMPFKNISDTCVDHCHITKKIRSLLCRKCNLGLGLFNDSLTNLKMAIKYLEKYND